MDNRGQRGTPNLSWFLHPFSLDTSPLQKVGKLTPMWCLNQRPFPVWSVVITTELPDMGWPGGLVMCILWHLFTSKPYKLTAQVTRAHWSISHQFIYHMKLSTFYAKNISSHRNLGPHKNITLFGSHICNTLVYAVHFFCKDKCSTQIFGSPK